MSFAGKACSLLTPYSGENHVMVWIQIYAYATSRQEVLDAVVIRQLGRSTMFHENGRGLFPMALFARHE